MSVKCNRCGFAGETWKKHNTKKCFSIMKETLSFDDQKQSLYNELDSMCYEQTIESTLKFEQQIQMLLMTAYEYGKRNEPFGVDFSTLAYTKES